jgi:hypothetical protein
MTIGRRAGSALLATAALTAASIGLFATSALASPASTRLTVKVSGGGTFTASTGTGKNAVNTTLTVKVSGVPVAVVCKAKGKTPASSASGNIKSGTYTGTAPVKIGTTSNLKFNNCVGPLGPVTTKVLEEPYLTKIDSKTNSKGQTDGIISGVDTQVSQTGCTFTVSGSSPGYYTNGKHTLTMTPKLPVKPLATAQLTISNVKGSCGGLASALKGLHPTFTSVFTLSRKGIIKST